MLLMENKIPTIKDLKLKLSDTNYVTDEGLLHSVIALITIFPKFRLFLEETSYNEDYELATIIFAQVIDYIEILKDSNEHDDIVRILCFLDVLSLSGNEEVVNLISIGFLENLDNSNWILSYLLPIMPDNLKKLFMHWYSHYLD